MDQIPMYPRNILNGSIAAALIFYAVLITPMASAQGKYKPGQTFKDYPDCPEMVVIPGGTFTMGSPENENGHSVVEGPQKQISIAQFAAGRFDVTRGQWEAFVKATNRPVTAGCAFSGSKDITRKDWEADSNPAKYSYY